MTTASRNDAVPQLKCLGGPYYCKSTPKLVQCTNQGSNGSSIQWECEAKLQWNDQFGQINVSCEGYSGPNDTYILKGSCGLQYTLKPKSKSLEEKIVFLCILAIIPLVVIYHLCVHEKKKIIQPNHMTGHYPNYDYHSNRGGRPSSSGGGGGRAASSGSGGTSMR